MQQMNYRRLSAIRLTIIIFFVCFLMGSVLCFGDFKLPKKVYTIDKLEDAKKEAKEKKWPLTFLYSNVDTDSGLCADFSLAAIREFSTKTVVVYFSFKERASVPKNVMEALSTPESGKFIPKLGFFDESAEKLIAILPYETMSKNQFKAFSDVKKKLRESAEVK